jgi:hypothetical protein
MRLLIDLWVGLFGTRTTRRNAAVGRATIGVGTTGPATLER